MAAAAADEFEYEQHGSSAVGYEDEFDNDNENENEEDAAGVADVDGELADPDEKTYCYCGQVSFGQMVGCDGDDCEKEWVSLLSTSLLIPSLCSQPLFTQIFSHPYSSTSLVSE